jgi:hypothetical protein
MDQQYLPNKKSQIYNVNQLAEASVSRCTGQCRSDNDAACSGRDDVIPYTDSERAAKSRRIRVSGIEQKSKRHVQSRKKYNKGGENKGEIHVEEVS